MLCENALTNIMPVTVALGVAAASDPMHDGERSRWRPCSKKPLRGHASGAHTGKPSTVSPGAKRRANPEGVSLMDETNNTQTRFLAATRRDEALFAHSGVARRRLRPGARSVECGSGGGYTAIAIACGGPTRFRTGATRNREPVGVRK